MDARRFARWGHLQLRRGSGEFVISNETDCVAPSNVVLLNCNISNLFPRSRPQRYNVHANRMFLIHTFK